MPGVGAIVFKTSLDDADFQKGLNRMATSANNYAQQISTKMRQVESQTRFGGTGGAMGGHGGGHGSTRIAGDVLNAATGTTGGVMELRALQGLTGATLGMAVAGIAAFKAYEHLSEALGKVRTASDEASRAFGRQNATLIAAGPKVASEQIEKLTENAKKLEESRTMSSRVANISKMAFGQALNDWTRPLGLGVNITDEEAKSRTLQLKSETDAQKLREDTIQSKKKETD